MTPHSWNAFNIYRSTLNYDFSLHMSFLMRKISLHYGLTRFDGVNDCFQLLSAAFTGLSVEDGVLPRDFNYQRGATVGEPRGRVRLFLPRASTLQIRETLYRECFLYLSLIHED